MAEWQVIQGDCLDVLRTLPDASVDAVVTDPPYGLSFMGKRWDYDVPSVEVWAECLRVLKPGGHLLAFAGTRTQHRMAVRIEDAGFEIRDMLAWVYSTGFPKSHNLGCKCRGSAIPYTHEVPRESASERGVCVVRDDDVSASVDTCEGRGQVLQPGVPQQGAPGIGEAWAEPEHEGRTQPGVEGRRDVSTSQGELQAGAIRSMPFSSGDNGANGRVRDGASIGGGNRTRKAIGADGVCSPHQPRPAGQSARESGTVRVESVSQVVRVARNADADLERCAKCGEPLKWSGWGTALKPALEPITMARKPFASTVAANVQEWGTGAINVDGCRVGTEQTITVRNGNSGGNGAYGRDERVFERINPPGRWPANLIHDGSDEVVGVFPEAGGSKPGSFQREKTSRGLKGGGFGQERSDMRERTELTKPGYEDSGSAARFFYCAKASRAERGGENNHPTVKPAALMAYLCRLVTPPRGVVLDPFTGSGSTGIGAIREGFNFVGIEREAEYVEIARRRIATAADNLYAKETP